MGDGIPGGRYIGTDGKLHDAQGKRLYDKKPKPKAKKPAPKKAE